MRRFRRLPAWRTVLVALVVACIHPMTAQTVPPSAKQEHANQWLDRDEESAIDQLFSRPADSPGYAVALIKDGQFVFSKGFGLANLDDNIAITPETSFHLASLSKQFTAAAVALL